MYEGNGYNTMTHIYLYSDGACGGIQYGNAATNCETINQSILLNNFVVPKSLTYESCEYTAFTAIKADIMYIHATRVRVHLTVSGQVVHGLSLLTMRPSKERDTLYRLDNNGWMLRLVQ